jgi:hypothetical protein
MKLHVSEFLRHLDTRPMTLIAEHGILSLPPGDKNRRSLAATFRPMLIKRANSFSMAGPIGMATQRKPSRTQHSLSLRTSDFTCRIR